MSRRPSPSDQARQIYLDAYTLAGLIDDATHNLDLGLAGWPTSTPGASPAAAGELRECPRKDCNESVPCPVHDKDETADTFGPVETEWGHQPAEKTTATERLATTRDKAADDLQAITEAIRKAVHHTAIAATIANQWAHAGIDETTVKARLVAIDAEIWCANCVRYGRHEPRAKDRTECDFCSAFRQQRKRGAPKEIWDARDARNGRLDETTISRILKQIDTERKAAAAAARARQRAEGKAS